MSAHSSRRGFLRGLTSLPLIGGSVALIGTPTRAAVPVTPGMLATYSAWLHFERRALDVSFNDDALSRGNFVPCLNPGSEFHWQTRRSSFEEGLAAQRRAAIVLAAVGCPLTSAEAEEQWASTYAPAGYGEGGR
ncbi:hypothetical protein [Methylobacterium dankookense]|uniref:Uncharacterized protein n=1 Tax=Methylobacterium dankookense TaxID=560405 RepID=A0A564G515_9HYPH|nr:hypothetical protein [Methylobacterium dankookense]GJD58370.1 hypothetical protein IFDJLNFL_4289 [Methylobacterium dankookense]VUF15625.1 hypothetical protein MTDSW087_05369 [Methylobacterium dankookense]